MRRKFFVTALAVVVPVYAAFAQPVEAEPVSQLEAAFEAIEHPVVATELDPPESLTVGRAVIRPGAEARLLSLSADGRDVGYVLDGPADLVYTVENRFSVPPARHNLKRADGVDVEASKDTLTMSTTLEGMAVWAWDLDLGVEAGDPVTSGELPDRLRELLDQKYSVNPGRALLLADRHGDPGYRWAVFRAKGEDFVLVVDPRPARRAEYLYRLQSPLPKGPEPYAGRRLVETMISQPIGREWWESEAIEFVSTETEVDVVNEADEHVRVTTKTRLQAMRDGMQILPMSHLSGRSKDGRWHEFRIESLTLDGEPVSYLRRHGALLVELPDSVSRGDSFLLQVVAEGDILERPAGDNYWWLSWSPWYPKPGPGGEEWAQIRIRAQAPDPFRVFAGGEILKSSEDGERNVVETRLEGPMRSGMVLAGNYRTTTRELDGARVHISSYASVKEDAVDRISQVVLSMMECLGSWLGVPYPFQDLQVIEVNSWGFGQAPPGLIFVTQEAFLTRASARVNSSTHLGAALTSRGINERVAHEVAHAWFPHVAKVVRSEENWLSESLADYTSAVCLQQKMSNRKKGRKLFERQLQDWKNRSKDAGDVTSVYLANHLAGTSEDRRTRQYLLYGRGPLVLHAIRQELQDQHGEDEGDRLFFTWIRSYVKNFHFKAAETRHLVTMLEQITRQDWQPFFERFIYGVESPEVD